MARVPYVTADDLSAEYDGLLDAYRPPEDIAPEYQHLMSGRERNVFRLLAHLPEALSVFRDLGGILWDEAGFSPRERELVVLTVARETDSVYVWHQHARIALNAGLPPADVLAVSDRDRDALAPAEHALVEYVTAYISGAVDDDVHAALAAHYDDATVVGVGFLAAFYLTICRSMDALGADLEEPFVGWDLARV